jgi:hypothetical protein
LGKHCFGETLFLGNVVLGKHCFGETLFWGNVVLGKRRFGETSFWGNVICGKSHLGKKMWNRFQHIGSWIRIHESIQRLLHLQLWTKLIQNLEIKNIYGHILV